MTPNSCWRCGKDMEAGNPEACRHAILALLHAIPEVQRGHAFRFCLDEFERLHVSAGCPPPPWINVLRDRGQ
jgi:hypothetical protein